MSNARFAKMKSNSGKTNPFDFVLPVNTKSGIPKWTPGAPNGANTQKSAWANRKSNRNSPVALTIPVDSKYFQRSAHSPHKNAWAERFSNATTHALGIPGQRSKRPRSRQMNRE